MEGAAPSVIARAALSRPARTEGSAAETATTANTRATTPSSIVGTNTGGEPRPSASATRLRSGWHAIRPSGKPITQPPRAATTIWPVKTWITCNGVNPIAFIIPTSR